MSGGRAGPRAGAGARPLLQLPCVLATLLVLQFDPGLGLLSLSLLAVLWPPVATFRPVAARATLTRYGVFVLPWLVFVALYLHAAAWLGHTIAPQPQLERLAQHGVVGAADWVVVFGIVVVAPLFEELVFRGYLFAACVAVRLPTVATQLIVASLFGLVHGLDYALPIGVLALLFGWLRQRYGSLLPSMLAHAVHNGLTVLVTVSWPGHLDILYPR